MFESSHVKLHLWLQAAHLTASSKKGHGHHHKHEVLSLVDRTTDRKRSVVVDNQSAKTLLPILKENIAAEARVMTDEASRAISMISD